jgi:hypothetical protein
MTLEKFTINKDQNEHRKNELHILCRCYELYIKNGVPEKEARRYIKWQVKYCTYERREEDE